MKSISTLNLVMGIIYTIILVLASLSSLVSDDFDSVLGAIILSGPVVANWITYNKLRKVKILEDN